MRRARGVLLLASLLGLSALGSPSATGCTDSTTGPGTLCDRIRLSMGGWLITVRCGGATQGGNTNIQRDDQGRVISFDFDHSCIDGTDRLVGSVFGAVYDAQGQIVSYQATINGQSCTYP